MKMKIMILFCSVLVCLSCLNAQKNMPNKTNQYNERGQKEGLWVDSSKYRITETYYHNDLLSGIYKEYYAPNGQLLVLGEYYDGKRCGIWRIYTDDGHLWFLFKDISENTFIVTNEGDGKRYTPDYKCYLVSYYPNGKKQDEGLVLWDEGESPISDLSVEYGEWKYYNEDGTLKETKVFK